MRCRFVAHLVAPLALTRVAFLPHVRTASGPSCAASPTIMSARSIPTLTAADAQSLDEELMAQPGFSLDQLMELAGLSVAAAVEKHYPLETHSRVLAVCGPGNNGGDGLVAARHLVHFGREVTVVLPKLNTKLPIFTNLRAQLEALGVPMLEQLPDDLSGFHVVIDAIFGFSFGGEARPPFGAILSALRESQAPIVSVDVPSGWHVDEGDMGGAGLRPAVLVSLTAPKGCSSGFTGAHYLGGRFVPPGIADKYKLHSLPPFPGAEQVVRLS